MNLLSILIILIVAGVLLYIVNNYIPLDPKIKKIINIVAVVIIIIWLLRALGVLRYLEGVGV